MQRVLRWNVPVDDKWHDIGAGRVVHVAARDHQERPGDLVEVWTLETTAADGIDFTSIRQRSAIVVGTGHPVPENTEHLGSAVVPTLHMVEQDDEDKPIIAIESRAGLVWHVFGAYGVMP